MKAFDVVKELNMKRVVEFVRKNDSVSRVEISEGLNIPQPTVTRIVEELLKGNILKEVGLGQSTGGRRRVLLTFNEKCYYAVGVELGRSSVKMALTDLNGKFLSFRMKGTSGRETIFQIVRYVKNSLEEMLKETGIDRSLVLGIGVGLPGPLNEIEGGYFISPPNFYSEKMITLRSILDETLDFPVMIDNDANVAALTEKWFGKGKHLKNFIYVLADVGIGSGIIVNGNLYRGLNGEAGEIGHSTVDLFGEKCSCGNYGCLETLVSIPKIEEAVQKKLKIAPEKERNIYGESIDSITFHEIVSALKNHSAIAQQTFEEAAQYLGVAISNLINFFAPEMVILGGGIGFVPYVLEVVKSTVATRVLSIGGKRIPIVSSEFRDGVVLGAAALVINDTFALSSLS
ncbi:xylose repressor [Collibacillus ludicampi]|uniref:Xylose repressor n=1 Tax=Collibacillus ludicampi TaxID=2771369 RepID=A0AAV4LJL7_9BACL|nr:ROK family transcriptional regulator [Collibacillus ludicampi]GIM47940.1 xylose repressor [Collibacillus ludicampi]